MTAIALQQPATGEPSTEEFLEELSLPRFLKVSRLLAAHVASCPIEKPRTRQVWVVKELGAVVHKGRRQSLADLRGQRAGAQGD
ncbi:unnamed protein product [Lota lota]